jgi:transcriptional regulator with XRE-family HTH domain
MRPEPLSRAGFFDQEPCAPRGTPLDSDIPEVYSSMMESSVQETHARLAERLFDLRAERGLTLDALSDRAGVSRSMISLIERGESSPTAAVLHRLAVGLGVTLASLFDEADRADAAPVSRRAEQSTWRDPGTGYVRRNLSPPGYLSPLELVEVLLPSGTHVSYDAAGSMRAAGISQQVWVLEGEVEVTVDEAAYLLEAGDCLAMQIDRPTGFRNRERGTARYLVALTGQPPASWHAALDQPGNAS